MQDSKLVNSQSRGNNERHCCRLFHYIDNAFHSRGSKHPESGDHHHKPTMEVLPVMEVSSKNAEIPDNTPSISKIRSRGSNLGSESEIEIEFRHTENEQEMWNNHNGEMKTTHAGPSSVTSNNGSAIEEFLKSRKEAMRRYYTMDHKEKQ